MNQINKKPPKVLIFNSQKRLVAISQSTTITARLFNVATHQIVNVCVGRGISCKRLYFRFLQDDIEVTVEDIGVLKIEEYDELCGVKRKVYRTGSMSRKGTKYKKRVKTVDNESISSKQIKA